MLWIIPAIAALTAGTASTPAFVDQAQAYEHTETQVVAVSAEVFNQEDDYELSQIGW